LTIDHQASSIGYRQFAMKYTKLSSRDCDLKLREMGNYLWELEQESDLASAEHNLSKLSTLNEQIRKVVTKAEGLAALPGYHQILGIYVVGLGYRMLQMWPQAADKFREVVEHNATNGEAWLELTWCLSEMNDHEGAAIAAKRSIEIFPKAAAAWGNLALALDRLGRTWEAQEALRRAVQLDPHDPRNEQIRQQLESRTS
jgi:tetratricopeptide (TPR) repeat protein